MTRSAAAIATLLVAATLAMPATAVAQEDLPPDVPICLECPPLWDQVTVESYRVDTVIADQMATTTVTQVLRNDGTGNAEALVLFPIPPDGTLSGLRLWIDGEPVAGDVLAAADARSTYEQIVAAIRDPALLEYADHGLARLSVYPVPPGGTRTVAVEYTQILTIDSGLIRYRHPLGAEIRGGAVESVQARIEITSAHRIAGISSPTHEVSVDRTGDGSAVIGYEGTGGDSGDLVLYIGLSDSEIGAHLVTYRDPAGDDDGFFLLLLSPGLADDAAVVDKDVILVVDRSGSMEGEKFAQAQAAARWVLGHLNDGDRFGLVTFSTTVTAFAGELEPAARAGAASDWLDGQSASGSTDIDGALRAAFDLAGDERPAYVVFLTDGLPTEGVTDTAAILDRARSRAPGHVSLFAFGVGWDVDTVLLDSLAGDHHGTATYVTPAEPVDEAVTGLYSKVANPVLTGVSVAVDGITVSDLYPEPLPDLFAGGQIALVGRYRGSGPATITVHGTVGDRAVSLGYDASFAATGGSEQLPRLWATRKVGHLLRQVRLDGPTEESIDQIVRLAIRYGIVTPYTSFLVTEDSPFGEEELARIAAESYDTATSTTVDASGEAAVAAASAAGDLADADAYSTPQVATDMVRSAGTRTFRLTDGVWIDTAWDPSVAPVPVPFLSDDYFALAAVDPDLAAALAVGDRAIVVWGGTAYQVVEAGETAATIEVPTAIGDPGTTSIEPTVTTPAPERAIAEGVIASGEERPGAATAVAVAVAIVALWAGLLAAAGRR